MYNNEYIGIIQMKVSVKRKRKEFGAPCVFKDRNVGDAKDGYIECTSYKDKTFDLQTVELDKGTQVSSIFSYYQLPFSHQSRLLSIALLCPYVFR